MIHVSVLERKPLCSLVPLLSAFCSQADMISFFPYFCSLILRVFVCYVLCLFSAVTILWCRRWGYWYCVSGACSFCGLLRTSEILCVRLCDGGVVLCSGERLLCDDVHFVLCVLSFVWACGGVCFFATMCASLRQCSFRPVSCVQRAKMVSYCLCIPSKELLRGGLFHYYRFMLLMTQKHFVCLTDKWKRIIMNLGTVV